MHKRPQLFIGALSLSACAIAQAQPVTAPKAKVYALISAVGDQFSYVTQKQSVGSNILDNYRRGVVRVPNNALNASILKALDRAGLAGFDQRTAEHSGGNAALLFY